ncbi:hypothetical protein ACN20G_36930 (plasmid) [Streptomyces sp. BI20]|uniref:hypothetical protein n=1 Tax=Streptomyces sp. BI20 TaxID=3403460 RepID=UPI003C737855
MPLTSTDPSWRILVFNLSTRTRARLRAAAEDRIALHAEIAALREAHADQVRDLTDRLTAALTESGRQSGEATAADGYIADLHTRIEHLVAERTQAELAPSLPLQPTPPVSLAPALTHAGLPDSPYDSQEWTALGDSLLETALTITDPDHRRDAIAAAHAAYTRALTLRQTVYITKY